jgi:2-polyprenyl-6-methoxyphenol hydroxylase-like FAD-dependent oxidoreductase
LCENGVFLFLIRVVDETLSDRSRGSLWRVICNHPEPLPRLESAEQTGPPVWTSSFHISHRICRRLTIGNVYFAGDAAHIHSPIGARGMNLGLEDAWVFAELVRTNRLSEYDELRRPVDARVVRQVELLTRMITAKSSILRIMWQFFVPGGDENPSLPQAYDCDA